MTATTKNLTVKQIRAQLTAAGIKFVTRDRKENLLARLELATRLERLTVAQLRAVARNMGGIKFWWRSTHAALVAAIVNTSVTSIKAQPSAQAA